MGDIIEAADRAAAMVSDMLNTEQPDGRRKPPLVFITPEVREKARRNGLRLPQDLTDGPTQPHPDTAAASATESVTPDPVQTLAAAIRIVEPNIELLATAPEQPALIWRSPYRCQLHADWITTAETDLAVALKMPDLEDTTPKKTRQFLRKHFKLKARFTPQVRELLDNLNQKYRAAGACEDCGGWGKYGQARELIDMTGMDITQQLVDLHHLTRAELGLTRLRHRYPMPCPRCGGRVGRDDGQTIVTCDDNNSCKSSWTENEYQFLAGLITRERLDMEILKWLLAEAYARLDNISEATGIISKSEYLDSDPAGGRVVLDIVDAAIGGHPTAAQRAIATDRKATEKRQTSEDNWAWGDNERPYRAPKPKPKPERKPIKNPIHPGSLTTLVDIDEDAVINGDARCRDCNLIHSGECA